MAAATDGLNIRIEANGSARFPAEYEPVSIRNVPGGQCFISATLLGGRASGVITKILTEPTLSDRAMFEGAGTYDVWEVWRDPVTRRLIGSGKHTVVPVTFQGMVVRSRVVNGVTQHGHLQLILMGPDTDEDGDLEVLRVFDVISETANVILPKVTQP